MASTPVSRKEPLSYDERHYRRVEQSGLVSSIVKMAETDLHILAPAPVEDLALPLLSKSRKKIEDYIAGHPVFATSLVPFAADTCAPAIVQQMLYASREVGVGPMAAVAGVIAEAVGQGLQALGISELIVENGGDLYVARQQECTVAIFAGESPLSGKLGIGLLPAQMPCGVCCSSATIGHSLSLGKADAVVVVASSTALADAAATRLANEVRQDAQSVNRALESAVSIEGLQGVVVISGEQLGAWGQIELVRL
jgi:ApbE superfamily uncharacterized protein (UPF0280 family)